jgi:quinol monooxygenase YgiN
MSDARWYLTIRKYSGTGAPEEIAQRVRDGLLPTLRQEPAFRAYYVARLDGGGGIFSATVFDDLETAQRTTERVLAWAGANLADLLTGSPVVTRANVTVHLDAERKGGESYMMVRTTEGLGPAAATLPTVQERLVPLTLEQPGFRHLYTGRDEAQADRSVAVSIFTNRSTATAAHAQVAALMAQHRDIWPQPPKVLLAGEVIVAALA